MAETTKKECEQTNNGRISDSSNVCDDTFPD